MNASDSEVVLAVMKNAGYEQAASAKEVCIREYFYVLIRTHLHSRTDRDIL